MTNQNRWQTIFIGGGGMTTGVSIGGLRLIFENNAKYTLEEAVTNGYIQPLVITASQAWSASYIWSNVSNIKTGGNTNTGNYPSLLVHLKTKTNKIKSIELYANRAFNTSYDGLYYAEWSSNFDMSISLFPGTSL